MSHAKQCDRCSGLYVPAPGCVRIEDYMVATRSKSANHEDAAGGRWNSYEADLCPPCSAEFAAWLRITLDDGEKPSQGTAP